MNPQLLSFMGLVKQYHPLLARFARLIIRDEKEAGHVTDRAFVELWYQCKDMQRSDAVRDFLRTRTRALCHAWLQDHVLQVRSAHPNEAGIIHHTQSSAL